jgi:hypothetical protein
LQARQQIPPVDRRGGQDQRGRRLQKQRLAAD